jgi:hypothetical protein
MNVIVFLGPSLNVNAARNVLDAEYRPPVQQGDVLRALDEKPDVIGIVDGFFHTVPAVWHKEILAALGQGVQVFGAASMGALRAAELHPFGMRGVGRVFEWFRDGVLEDDDEVAVVHGPADTGYREQSVAMVNVRDAIASAIDSGVLRADAGAAIVAAAKGLYYADRNYPAIVSAARAQGVEDAALEAFSRLLSAFRPSLKQRDALAMLAAIREHVAGGRQPQRVSFQLENTLLLEAIRNEVRFKMTARLPEPYDVDADRVVAGGERLKFLRKKVLLRHLALQYAERLGITIAPDEIQEMSHAFRRQFGLTTRTEMMAWMHSEGLDLDAFTEVMREFCAVKKMEQLFVHEIDRRVPSHMRVNSARDWQHARAKEPEQSGAASA